MAALVVDGAPDLASIARALDALPRYARPLFLRLRPALDATATFKPQRRALADEGFDPARVRDPLYVYDAEREVYVELDALPLCGDRRGNGAALNRLALPRKRAKRSEGREGPRDGKLLSKKPKP